MGSPYNKRWTPAGTLCDRVYVKHQWITEEHHEYLPAWCFVPVEQSSFNEQLVPCKCNLGERKRKRERERERNLTHIQEVMYNPLLP